MQHIPNALKNSPKDRNNNS